MLTINRLTRIFGGENGVRNVSFSVEKGEIIGLLGKSGSGKSTILKAITGLDQGYSGDILINGEKIQGPHEEIGVVFQEPRLFPWLTVLENVQFGLNRNKKENIAAARELLKEVGLEHAENLYVKQLSGGMAQRVSIARALVTNPGLLLLDEPFSALDAFTKMQLQDLVLKIWKSQQLTAVIVTHDIDEALYLCDRILVLSGKPGQVEREFRIDEPRPRNRGSETLARMKAEILHSLGIEAVYS
ncbi:ABC transporter ATP-binding protein [Ureibacillus sp. FSL K6-8385]|uniref:ABC transporter ATP-binding protein n=1 Tax=Ureibacillus terrenus TaxID=118246 RepID=A0A540V5M9_9BACL|nr:ABC transporter ATP-binding protein [Ureibacillus terrenus]MED3661277.1 ABC transporter ATP-binding protein [Ureibacillus terrenus]MED3764249.1 ABC transporter ATP-binding protein [Ureibacillus terrenus]TQE92065.1 ABC transporter ATP-binding protein [Ureibacillus terrenus]